MWESNSNLSGNCDLLGCESQILLFSLSIFSNSKHRNSVSPNQHLKKGMKFFFFALLFLLIIFISQKPKCTPTT